MVRRVVVTGAQGFVGRYLVADWLMADSQVTLVGVGRSVRLDEHFSHDLRWGDSRRRAPLPSRLAEVLRGERYRYVRLDVTDASCLTRLLTDIQPDMIVHLAASLRGDSPVELVRANIGAVASLFEATARAGLGPVRIVLGSSGSVYGDIPGRPPPFHEDAACAPVDPYAVTKWAAERLSRVLADRHGLSALWARIFNPVGPGQHERHLCGSLGGQVAAIVAGVQSRVVSVGPLDTTRDLIDIRDTASAIRLIATKGIPGAVYNVASGRETSGQQVLDTLVDLAGLAGRVRLEPCPHPPGVSRHYADVARLVALGHAPRYSLRNSLIDILEYYRTRVPPDIDVVAK